MEQLNKLMLHLTSWDKAKIIRQSWSDSSKRVVFTNGCFDLLHPGHVQYLKDAKALGDVLIVGLNADASISRLKGETRPINPLDDRAAMLIALEAVDLVVAFEEDTPLLLIQALLPDVLVKGGDYTSENIVGAKEVIEHGGHVIVVPFLEGYSSSELIQRIQAS